MTTRGGSRASASRGCRNDHPPPRRHPHRRRSRHVKRIRNFVEQVLRKRPYIDPTACAAVIAAPLWQTVQDDGRIRHWGRVIDTRDGKQRILRVVTLNDGETIHNAFYDRDFRENAT